LTAGLHVSRAAKFIRDLHLSKIGVLGIIGAWEIPIKYLSDLSVLFPCIA